MASVAGENTIELILDALRRCLTAARLTVPAGVADPDRDGARRNAWKGKLVTTCRPGFGRPAPDVLSSGCAVVGVCGGDGVVGDGKGSIAVLSRCQRCQSTSFLPYVGVSGYKKEKYDDRVR
jgi:hypothetical protein